MSLDEDQGLVSVDSATTEATQVPAAVVSEARAQRTALGVTARSHQVARRRPRPPPARVAGSTTRPSCTPPTLGVRPVWEFEVTNGSDIRETGAGRHRPRRGGAALQRRTRDRPRICDNANPQDHQRRRGPDLHGRAARVEGGPARRHRRQRRLRQPRRDLGRLRPARRHRPDRPHRHRGGVGPEGADVHRPLVLRDDDCPFDNAFWDGTQMVFGAAAPPPTTWSATSSPTATSSTPPACSPSTRAAPSTSRLPTRSARSSTTATGSDPSDADWRIGEDLPGGGYCVA